MLGIFFLLVWVTVIAALTSHERNRSALLLSEHSEDELGPSLPSDDPALLVRYYRVALARSMPIRDEQLLRINLACALNALADHRQALEELDRVQLQQLNPLEVALWLNNRAYTLVFLGQPDDAVGHLDDAVELLLGDDGDALVDDEVIPGQRSRVQRGAGAVADQRHAQVQRHPLDLAGRVRRQQQCGDQEGGTKAQEYARDIAQQDCSVQDARTFRRSARQSAGMDFNRRP